jgi:hypothetical protein
MAGKARLFGDEAAAGRSGRPPTQPRPRRSAAG